MSFLYGDLVGTSTTVPLSERLADSLPPPFGIGGKYLDTDSFRHPQAGHARTPQQGAIERNRMSWLTATFRLDENGEVKRVIADRYLSHATPGYPPLPCGSRLAGGSETVCDLKICTGVAG